MIVLYKYTTSTACDKIQSTFGAKLDLYGAKSAIFLVVQFVQCLGTSPKSQILITMVRWTDPLESQSCQNVVVARTKKLEPRESKFCVRYGQKLDPTDLVLHGWSYMRRMRTDCCQFTSTHKSKSTNNQKLDVEIQKQTKSFM
jgi:hypothetical protein